MVKHIVISEIYGQLKKALRSLANLISKGIYRSSRPEVFSKKCFLRNFAKFTGKHLFSFNIVAGLRPEACNYIKREHHFYRTPTVAASEFSYAKPFFYL